jgi:acetyltransferase EpsM
VIGGGEHAAVVADAVRSRPHEWYALGFADPAPPPDASRRLGLDHLGGDDVVIRLLADARADPPALVLGFGSAAARRAAAVETFGGATWATVVHAAAWVSPSAEIGEGSVVFAGAVVNAGARLGRHVIVNSGAIVEHDVQLDDFAHVGPGATIGGAARVGRETYLGLGAVVRDHVVIGPGAMVGMGAVVVDEVKPGTTVIGSPARPRESVTGR